MAIINCILKAWLNFFFVPQNCQKFFGHAINHRSGVIRGETNPNPFNEANELEFRSDPYSRVLLAE